MCQCIPKMCQLHGHEMYFFSSTHDLIAFFIHYNNDPYYISAQIYKEKIYIKNHEYYRSIKCKKSYAVHSIKKIIEYVFIIERKLYCSFFK